MTAVLILLVIAIILWFLAAIPIPIPNPVSLGWLGMFFFGLYLLVGKHFA